MQQRYFVGVSLPSEIAARVDDLRCLFRRRGEKAIFRNTQHVTIKIPFESHLSADELVKILTPIAHQVRSFTAQLTGLDHFEKRVIYLAVEPIAPFLELRNRILDRMADLGTTLTDRGSVEHDRGSMQPHVTLTILDSEREFGRAMKLLEKQPMLLESWLIEQINLYQWQLHQWQSIAQIDLVSQ